MSLFLHSYPKSHEEKHGIKRIREKTYVKPNRCCEIPKDSKSGGALSILIQNLAVKLKSKKK